jgi:hypothetical protein
VLDSGSAYGPGRRIAGDDSRYPWVDWVLYQLEVDGPLYAALYVGGCLVYADAHGFWRHDWALFCNGPDRYEGPLRQVRVPRSTIERARACWRPGWPLLPTQGGLV